MVDDDTNKVVDSFPTNKIVFLVHFDEENDDVKSRHGDAVDIGNGLAQCCLVLFGVGIARDVETVKRHVWIELS